MSPIKLKILKWLLRNKHPIELLGYAAANAGYTDEPELTSEYFKIWATGKSPSAGNLNYDPRYYIGGIVVLNAVYRPIPNKFLMSR